MTDTVLSINVEDAVENAVRCQFEEHGPAALEECDWSAVADDAAQNWYLVHDIISAQSVINDATADEMKYAWIEICDLDIPAHAEDYFEIASGMAQSIIEQRVHSAIGAEAAKAARPYAVVTDEKDGSTSVKMPDGSFTGSVTPKEYGVFQAVVTHRGPKVTSFAVGDKSFFSKESAVLACLEAMAYGY